jgi:TolB protein
VMNADGTGIVPLTSDPACDAEFPASSPDGTKIAYQLVDSVAFKCPTVGIWVMNADGTNKVQLTGRWKGLNVLVAPAWAPDGSRIAYQSARKGSCSNNHSEVWVMNADGTGQASLTHGCTNNGDPAWQP